MIRPLPLVRIQALQVFGVRLPELDIVCHELPSQSPVRGLLGLNVLKQLSLHLDFPHRTLRVTI